MLFSQRYLSAVTELSRKRIFCHSDQFSIEMFSFVNLFFIAREVINNRFHLLDEFSIDRSASMIILPHSWLIMQKGNI